NTLILDPTEDILARVVRSAEDRRPAPAAESERNRPATTADGTRVRLDANIEFPDDLADARYAGAEGIGLYRSEFLLSSGACDTRDEERQHQIYRDMVEGMAPGVVTIRTFDIDEQQLAALGFTGTSGGDWMKEDRANRQGLRGLRLSLSRPDVFRV